VDVTNTDRPRLAMLNGDEMKYAASLPKVGSKVAELPRGLVSERSLFGLKRFSVTRSCARPFAVTRQVN